MDEKKEQEEYEKRIRDLVNKMEKEKDVPEDYKTMLGMYEDMKLKTISDLDDKRNNVSILSFMVALRGYQGLIADPKYPNEENEFQAEIDRLFNLIYEELKKPSLFFQHIDPDIKKEIEIRVIKKDLAYVKKLLGSENYKYFYKKYNLRALVRDNSGISFFNKSVNHK